jgi:hypothetical protein
MLDAARIVHYDACARKAGAGRVRSLSSAAGLQAGISAQPSRLFDLEYALRFYE